MLFHTDREHAKRLRREENYVKYLRSRNVLTRAAYKATGFKFRNIRVIRMLRKESRRQLRAEEQIVEYVETFYNAHSVWIYRKNDRTFYVNVEIARIGHVAFHYSTLCHFEWNKKGFDKFIKKITVVRERGGRYDK